MYNDRMGSAFAKASASASGSAGGGAGGGPGLAANANLDESGSSNRSVTISENGQKITITERDGAITVRANGKTIRAKNMADLGMKSPEALRLYKRNS